MIALLSSASDIAQTGYQVYRNGLTWTNVKDIVVLSGTTVLGLAAGRAADADFVRRTTRNIRVDGLLVRARLNAGAAAGVRRLGSLEQQVRGIGERLLTRRARAERSALQQWAREADPEGYFRCFGGGAELAELGAELRIRNDVVADFLDGLDKTGVDARGLLELAAEYGQPGTLAGPRAAAIAKARRFADDFHDRVTDFTRAQGYDFIEVLEADLERAMLGYKITGLESERVLVAGARNVHLDALTAGAREALSLR